MINPAKIIWALYGGAIGIFGLLVDLLVGWQDVTFAPWAGEGIIENLGHFAGSMLGGAVIGLIAGTIRDAVARRTGQANLPKV